MGGYSSPLLDQYNRDGIVTPGLQRAMEIAKAKLPTIQFPQVTPGGSQQQPTQGAMPPLAPTGQAPVPQLQMPKADQSATSLPLMTTPQVRTPAVAPSPDVQHKEELDRLAASKPGVAQIRNPWLRGLATAGDIALGTFFPRAAMLTPGTTLHHQMLLNRQSGLVNLDDESRLRNAQAAEQGSLPELHKAQADLNAEKIAHKNEVDQANLQLKESEQNRKKDEASQRDQATLAQHGFKRDQTGSIVSLPYEEMSEPQQAAHDLSTSHRELTEATAELRRAQTAGEPEKAKLAEQRIATAQLNANTAIRRLGLSEQQFGLKVGGAPEESALPGQLTQDGKTVGTAFQGNVKPTTTQRDAAGRADTMLDLDARIRKALKNPELAKETGPLIGRLNEAQNRLGTLPHDLAELKNDLVSYGAFQAGLHPVRGIGALEYFDKVMGGLGQTPEELLGKLDSNKATAESVKRVGGVHTEPRPKSSNPHDPLGVL
ncbi:MAG: hypothetical protein KGL39_20375 [Patescibacteria group bacterium]|nr:hypothetical protein [Patescibacteria group bacterium]